MALDHIHLPTKARIPISAKNVTLRIPIRRKAARLLANPFSLLANFYTVGTANREVRTIIQDISFEVENGSRLALIGPNGAGKTTLLRLLAGSYAPTRGTIKLRGTVQALLNMSLGIRAKATGLENIYLLGLSMGMTLVEIREKIPEIVEFSELGAAIHDPIQTYSAGMQARLAFSVVTSCTPNILLMDEWISAGDKYFVDKAQKRIRSQVETCKALVLASHSKGVLSEICTHGLVINAGHRAYYGPIDDALKFYDDMRPTRLDRMRDTTSELSPVV